jgi:hypothetical protein
MTKEKKTNNFGCVGMIVYVLFVGWFCGQLMNGNPVSEFVGTVLCFGFIVLGVFIFRDK